MVQRKKPKRDHLRRLNKVDMRKLKSTMLKNPHSSSKSLFEDAGVPMLSKSKRCKILNGLGSVRSPIKKPPLSKINREKRYTWCVDNMKTNFSNVFFSDECRATLDGPDCWSKGWVEKFSKPNTKFRRQQRGFMDELNIKLYSKVVNLKIKRKLFCGKLEHFPRYWSILFI